MDNAFGHYDQFAEVFTYPMSNYHEIVKILQKFLGEKYLNASKKLKYFTNVIINLSSSELEELFTRTFDVQAITTIDIGYVLFGEDYKRGALLVNLNREHELAGNDCQKELSDHLPNILRLLPKMENKILRAELVERIITPSLVKIICEFDPERLCDKNKVYKKHHKTIIENSESYGSVFQYPLKALYEVLCTDFNLGDPAEPAITQQDTFLRSIDSEIRIET
jgi:nitrate reductase assembly molybdenum cofactor insertion protein NarJ